MTALLNVARGGWIDEGGLGGEGAGVEVIATYVNGSTVRYDMKFTTYKPSDALNALSNPRGGHY